jgi:hypothetical protein
LVDDAVTAGSGAVCEGGDAVRTRGGNENPPRKASTWCERHVADLAALFEAAGENPDRAAVDAIRG